MIIQQTGRRSNALAIDGGQPVRNGRAWPAWPRYDGATEQAVVDAIRARRWTVSWPGDGSRSRERRFAEAFAGYNGVPYCVSVDHGSSALLVALEALDVGAGDEVVVPAMTWVAPATAVLRAGALPVLADVDAETGCVTADTIREALSERTKAIIVVHLGCTVADLDGILALAAESGVKVIEDCAQAHGARWRGRPVGTHGAAGAFSFQAGKVLAAGEGGAVITSDPETYRRAQQLRADSRRYPDDDAAPGEMELVEQGDVLGANYCMSELAASVLLDQLPRLDADHVHREQVAQELELGLAELGDFGPIPLPPQADKRSVYEYGIRFAPGTFGDAPASRVGAALSAELGIGWFPPDDPLHRSIMLRPETKRRYAAVWTDEGRRRALHRSFDGCERFCETTLLCHHRVLLGDSVDVQDIVRALDKVRSGHDAL
ncbi:MAG: L-glutamine:scyllo-inosose aminotransferase [Solirubrobacteraceae bacterium]|jgi:L-glutamine:2-deoxy-scyllo-inosose/3-amino-2,3-dideoxy-scyllo-inosose aminotransferase|nr:L-glutamine:scyllo-inosose aminotransferase [Solirubrobacteraceae bacterium]